MRRDTWNSPIDEDTIPTAAEVEGFNPQEGPCCSVQNFRPDLNNPAGTPWNASATNVFVKDFVSAKVYPSASRFQVAKAFRTHLGRLRTFYKEFRSGGVPPTTQKARNADERRRNVSTTRSLPVLLLIPCCSFSRGVWESSVGMLLLASIPR